MTRSRHSGVTMGGNEKMLFCSQFLLMNKGVKCDLIFRSFGRFSIAARSQDAKNTSAAESMHGSLYFESDLRQPLPLSIIQGRFQPLYSASFEQLHN